MRPLLIGFILCLSSLAQAQGACEKALRIGALFLHQRNTGLSQQFEVERTARRFRSSAQPGERIHEWLKYLEKSSKNPERKDAIKRYYAKTYVLTHSQIPQSYYDLQIRILREQGHGNVQLNDQLKAQLADTVIGDQKDSLDAWLDYFLSADTQMYPMWAKYWAFNGVLKLGKFDPETKEFANRSKGQVSPYVELDREALGQVMDLITRKVGKQSLAEIQDAKLLQLLDGANFGKLYAHAWREVRAKQADLTGTTDGQWVLYKKGSDAKPLVESLQGFATGWCTANQGTAEAQLKGGDFWVYYSKDRSGVARIPRLAIRKEDLRIAEVRGIAIKQNLDPEIASSGVLDSKLKTFGTEGALYTKRSQHMKRLTEIERKTKNQQDLSKEDLRFLYEIDEQISGFGYGRDPRIEEIIALRNVRPDLARALSLRENQISLNREEALRGGIVYHYGHLNVSRHTQAQGLTLPAHIGGDLDLSSLTSAKGLTLPTHIGGDLDLSSLTSAQGLTLPAHIGGDLDLLSLTSAQGLTLPTHIGGGLYLSSLTSAQGLTLPTHIGGALFLRKLTSAQGLTLPTDIGGGLYLSSLTSAQGLTLPTHVGGILDLSGLTSAQGLSLPTHIDGFLDLSGLTSARGLTLPNHVGGSVLIYSTRDMDAVFADQLRRLRRASRAR